MRIRLDPWLRNICEFSAKSAGKLSLETLCGSRELRRHARNGQGAAPSKTAALGLPAGSDKRYSYPQALDLLWGEALPMAGAEIRLLGKMAVFDRSGRPVELPLRKAQGLLAFLALNPDHRHSRQRLAGLLWGDHGEEQARRSLTKSLTALRRSLGGDAAQILGADTQHVWLKSDAIHIDIEALRSLVTEDGESAVEAALALCGGELMEDFVLREAAFNDWLTAERMVAQRLQAEILAHLTGACLERRDGESAVALAERLVGIDPLDEEAHRLLMRAHEQAGRRSAALAQYQACKDLLAHELGVAPEEATRALFEALKASGGERSSVRCRRGRRGRP